MKRIPSTFFSLVQMIGISICMYYAFRYNAIWGKNIIAFWTWFMFIIIAIGNVALSLDREYKSLKDNTNTYIPRWLSLLWDIGLIVCMAAKGWFLLAIVLTITLFLSLTFSAKCKQIRKRLEARQREGNSIMNNSNERMSR
jgi:hypothetical protein